MHTRLLHCVVFKEWYHYDEFRNYCESYIPGTLDEVELKDMQRHPHLFIDTKRVGAYRWGVMAEAIRTINRREPNAISRFTMQLH